MTSLLPQLTQEQFDQFCQRSRQSAQTIELVRDTLMKRQSVNLVAEAHQVSRAHIYDSLHRFLHYEEREGELTEAEFQAAAEYWYLSGKKADADACKHVLVDGWSIVRAAEQQNIPLVKLQDLVRRLRARHKRLLTNPERKYRLHKPEPVCRTDLTDEHFEHFRHSIYTRPLAENTLLRAQAWHVDKLKLHEISRTYGGSISDVRLSLAAFERYYGIHERLTNAPRTAHFVSLVAQACKAVRLSARATRVVTVLLTNKDSHGRIRGSVAGQLEVVAKESGIQHQRARQYVQQVAHWLLERLEAKP